MRKLLFFGCVALAAAGRVSAHEGHEHDAKGNHIPDTVSGFKGPGGEVILAVDQQKTDGKAEASPITWKRREDLCRLPADASKRIKELHGVFIDDPDTEVIYTILPGLGLCSLAPDMKEVKVIGGDKVIVEKANSHGGCVIHREESGRGTTYLGIASTNDRQVFITDLSGKVVAQLGCPAPQVKFASPDIQKHYAKANADFVPTSCAWDNEDQKLFVTTGYSSGDFVLEAVEFDHSWTWTGNGWGKRGNAPGEFQTGHGITVSKRGGKDTKVRVASRHNARVYDFSKEGKLLATLQLAEGSTPCSVVEWGNLDFFPLLNKVDKDTHAGVLVYGGKEKLAKLIPAAEGLDSFVHIHHVLVVSRGTSVFALVQAWNPGGIACFELSVPKR